MFTYHHEPAHKGRAVVTEPIRADDIRKVAEYVKDHPRDRAIWAVGTNSALRAGDLLSLTWDQLTDDGERITIELVEAKTRKRRVVVMNSAASAHLRTWRRLSNSPFVFSGQRGQLTVAALGRMVKAWVKGAGIDAKRVSTHTMRKTWVRAQHEQFGVPLYVLAAFFTFRMLQPVWVAKRAARDQP